MLIAPKTRIAALIGLLGGAIGTMRMNMQKESVNLRADNEIVRRLARNVTR